MKQARTFQKQKNMGSRLNPDAARQKFYARDLAGGFRAACFYNHRAADLSGADQARLIGEAARLFGDMPYMDFLGNPVPLMLYVDLADEFLRVGLMMMDQTAIGYQKTAAPYGVDEVVAAMEAHANGFRSREDNIPADKLALDDPRLMLGGIHQAGNRFSDALNRRDYGRTGRESGPN